MAEVSTNEERKNSSWFWRWFKHFMSCYWKTLIVFVWPLVCLPIFLLDNTSKKRCLYVVCIMALFWVTESLPLPITSSIPIGLFPLMGILDSKQTTIQYFQETIVMVWGSMILAIAIEKSGLTIRVALLFMRMLGTTHRKLTLGISFFTMFLSMWMANAAACAVVSPIAKSLLLELEEEELVKFYMDGEEETEDEVHKQEGVRERRRSQPYPSRTTQCYFLLITYAATIGGTGTIVGTGTNLTMKGIFETRFPYAPEVSFVDWMAYNILPMLVSQLLTWVYMNWLYLGLFRTSGTDPEIKKQLERGKNGAEDTKEIGKRIITRRYEELGPWNFRQIITAILFLLCVFLWIFRRPSIIKGWTSLITEHQVGDSVPCLIVILLFFMLPADLGFLKSFSKNEQQWPVRGSESLLLWSEIHKKMPWGLLFLLGGGFAIAEGSIKSSMSSMIANALKSLANFHPILLLFLVAFICSSITEFTSNVAIANIVLPVLADMAVATKIHPVQLMIPATICCSYAFMLPVGTPGNAFVAEVANIRTKDMMIAGLGPKFITLAVLVISFPTLGSLVYNTSTFPDWASNTTHSRAFLDSLHFVD